MLLGQAWRRRTGALSLFKRTVLTVSTLAPMVTVAQAQTAPVAKVADIAASERAAKEGDKVFQWIRIHSDKPRKAAAAPPVAGIAPAPVKVASRASAKPVDSATQEPAAQVNTALARSEPQTSSGKTGAQVQPEAATTQTAAARTDAGAPMAASTASPQVEIEEDVSLTPIFKSDPDFPGALMRTLRKGQVQVAFTVRTDGTVSDAHAVASTHPRLAPSAVATVAQWKFQPVRHPQQAVVELGFNLE
jgi:protein TonB